MINFDSITNENNKKKKKTKKNGQILQIINT